MRMSKQVHPFAGPGTVLDNGAVLVAMTGGRQAGDDYVLAYTGEGPQPWATWHLEANGGTGSGNYFDRLDHAAADLYRRAGWK